MPRPDYRQTQKRTTFRSQGNPAISAEPYPLHYFGAAGRMQYLRRPCPNASRLHVLSTQVNRLQAMLSTKKCQHIRFFIGT